MVNYSDLICKKKKKKTKYAMTVIHNIGSNIIISRIWVCLMY